MDKLIEQLGKLIERAGGEASRVWPDMVALYWWQTLAGMMACVTLGTICYGVAWRTYRHVKDKNGHEDLLVAVALLCIVATLLLIVGSCASIPDLLRPEAALINSFRGK